MATADKGERGVEEEEEEEEEERSSPSSSVQEEQEGSAQDQPATMRTGYLLLLAGIIIVLTCAAAVAELENCDPEDPEILELAKWAAGQKGIQRGELFGCVDQHAVGGINYRFLLYAVDDAGVEDLYEARVYEDEESKARKLISFTKLH